MNLVKITKYIGTDWWPGPIVTLSRRVPPIKGFPFPTVRRSERNTINTRLITDENKNGKKDIDVLRVLYTPHLLNWREKWRLRALAGPLAALGARWRAWPERRSSSPDSLPGATSPSAWTPAWYPSLAF
jgi:hypothetical protein